jgi:hypothetical protein
MSANLEMFEGSYVTEEMRMFRKSFRQFIQKECTPNRAKWKAQGMVDRDLVFYAPRFRLNTAAAAVTLPTIKS